MKVTLTTVDSKKIVIENVESVVPATDDFPQWAIYPEGGEDIVFYSASLVDALHIHDPAGKADEKVEKSDGVSND